MVQYMAIADETLGSEVVAYIDQSQLAHFDFAENLVWMAENMNGGSCKKMLHDQEKLVGEGVVDHYVGCSGGFYAVKLRALSQK